MRRWPPSSCIDGHALQPDAPGALEGRQEQPLAREEYVHRALHRLDVVGHARLVQGDVPRIHLEHLVGLQYIVAHIARDLEPDHAGAGDLLQDKALTAEQSGAQLASKVHLYLDALLTGHKGVLLADQALALGQLHRQDGSWSLGRKGHHRLAALAGIGGHKDRFARQSAPQTLHQAPARVGLHSDVALHPGHPAPFGIDRFARVQVDVQRWQHSALDLVPHGNLPLLVPGASTVLAERQPCTAHYIQVRRAVQSTLTAPCSRGILTGRRHSAALITTGNGALCCGYSIVNWMFAS